MENFLWGISVGAGGVIAIGVLVLLVRSGNSVSVLAGGDYGEVGLDTFLRQERRVLLDWYRASERATDDSETAIYEAGVALFDEIQLMLARRARPDEIKRLINTFLTAFQKRSELAELLVECCAKIRTKLDSKRDQDELLTIEASALLRVEAAFVKDASVASVYPQFVVVLSGMVRALPGDHKSKAVLAEIAGTKKEKVAA